MARTDTRTDTRTESQKALDRFILYASPNSIPEPRTTEIDGHTYTEEFFIVNRKCYDFQPTPTLLLKKDGKRIAYRAAWTALGQPE